MLMLGICAKAGVISNTIAAATLRILIRRSPLARSRAFSGRYITAPTAPPGVSGDGSKPVRLAGFRGLHPVVPDRSALGAAVQHEAHGDDTQNQYHPAKHERHTPLSADHGPQVWHFQAER